MLFVLCLIWMNLSKWQRKQVNIRLSSPPENKRQRELTLPSLFPSTYGLRIPVLGAKLIYQLITKMTGNT